MNVCKSSSRLGFVEGQNYRSPSWNESFQELQSYQAEHGNFNVPTKSGRLGRWVATQRTYHRCLKEVENYNHD